MAKVEPLNDTTHNKLRVNTNFDESLGYATGIGMLIPSEIQFAQRQFAIVFRKHEKTGQMIPNVMLGFEQDENLFLDGQGGWNVDYIPLIFKKGPFLIGPQKTEDAPEGKLVCFIDVEDPRVNQEVGEPIFDGPNLTEYMERTREVLIAVHEEIALMTEMVKLFEECDLIEPVSFDIEFVNGQKIDFQGAFTIAKEKLIELSNEQLAQLNEKGFLSLAFYLSDSLDNLSKLVDLKNQKIQALN